MELIHNQNDLMLYETKIYDIFKLFLNCNNISLEDITNKKISLEKKDNYWLIYENYKDIDYKVACFSNILDVLADALRRTIDGYKNYIKLKDEFLSIVLCNLDNLEISKEEKDSLTIKRYIKHY